jgi:hypothetical protein
LWVLNDVIVPNASEAVGGTCEDNVTVAYKVYLDAKMIGTLARCFHRAIFTVGAEAAMWSSNEEFDYYVSAAVMGIAETGHHVASRIHLIRKLDGRRFCDGCWRYKQDEVVVAAFVSNIENDVRCVLMSQSSARVLLEENFQARRSRCPQSRRPHGEHLSATVQWQPRWGVHSIATIHDVEPVRKRRGGTQNSHFESRGTISHT